MSRHNHSSDDGVASSLSTDSNSSSQDAILNVLINMFGEHLDTVVIHTVASECQWQVDKSMKALAEMSSYASGSSAARPATATEAAPPQVRQSFSSALRCAPSGSSSSSSQRNPAPRPKPPQPAPSPASLHYQKVVSLIQSGARVMVLMRGLPGAGKTFLAERLIQEALGCPHPDLICGADKFFLSRNGSYNFDATKLSEAHLFNQRRVLEAINCGVSPIVVDNTNTQMWEMREYVVFAVSGGYALEILEPWTPWAFSPHELSLRNRHNVPKAKIHLMLERYERNITPEKVLRSFGLEYAPHLIPPQPRKYPPMHSPLPLPLKSSDKPAKLVAEPEKPVKPAAEKLEKLEKPVKPAAELEKLSGDFDLINFSDDTDEPEAGFLKVDLSTWGVNKNSLESWNIVKPVESDVKETASGPLPQRQSRRNTEAEQSPKSSADAQTNTCCEDLQNTSYRRLDATSRDISEGCEVRKETAPPKITMLDKSSMTEDVVDVRQTKNFKKLKRCFPSIDESSLKYVFEQCNSDVNWAVDVLMDGGNEMNYEELCAEDDNEDEAEEVTEDQPEREETQSPTVEQTEVVPVPVPVPGPSSQGEDLMLKKLVEERFVISENLYSEHCLKIKRHRHGENVGEPVQVVAEADEPAATATTAAASPPSSSSGDSSSDSEVDTTSELTLGEALTGQLEKMFGRSLFPENHGFHTTIQLPKSLAKQLYTCWLESMYHQMEMKEAEIAAMVKEDEELAKGLQDFEKVGENPSDVVPNLQEIMDMEIALAIYQADRKFGKDAHNTIACKMKLQKLFEMFPNIDQAVLIDILEAHDYNLEQALEVLEASTGRSVSWQQVASQAKTKQTELLASVVKEREKQNEHHQPVSWNEYREEADNHMIQRNEAYKKVNECAIKGQHQVAQYYLDVARLHTKKLEVANNLAAVAFLEENSSRKDAATLDLHYLYVPEALQALDIFIDEKIRVLSDNKKSCQDIFIITGRGKNSEGGVARIKPAVQKRLTERNLGFSSNNPGLLKVRVQQHSTLSCNLK